MTIQEKTEAYVLQTYGRFPLTVTEGKGCRVMDDRGREYLDFCAGIATCSLGHCHSVQVEAIRRQSEVLMHCSNLYCSPPAAELAEVIVKEVMSEPGRVFFSNSGAEANDGLIKFARRYGQASGRYEVITFDQSFHGRTLGAMSATAQAKIHEGFDPLLPGFHYVPFNDLEAVKAALTEQTVGFLLEPIQGEGGVNVATPEFLRGLAELAAERDLLLLFDEVQCGFGRTGVMNGWQAIAPELKPDAVSWAKGMGGGFPIGAFWVKEEHTSLMGPGTHGSTYGGNALAAAASLAVVRTILDEKLSENAAAREDQIRAEISSWKHPAISEVRGHGLLLGIGLRPEKLETPEGKVASIHLCGQLLQAGLLVPPAGPETIRFLPPLNVMEEECDRALAILHETLKSHSVA